MAYRPSLSRRDRGLAALLTLGASLLAGALLVMGLQFSKAARLFTPDDMATLAFPIADPPPIAAKTPAQDADAGRASAANIRSKATQIAAPKPVIPPPKPPDIIAAPKANSGADDQSGATPVIGSGSGAGGTGDGTGSGGSGTGAGGGTRPVWKSGTIQNSDYPRSSASAKRGGEVEVRFTIQPTGRVTACRVSRSSGDPDLDATTCRLIEQRFQFRPATNSAGDPIASPYGWRQNYWLERR